MITPVHHRHEHHHGDAPMATTGATGMDGHGAVDAELEFIAMANVINLPDPDPDSNDSSAYVFSYGQVR